MPPLIQTGLTSHPVAIEALPWPPGCGAESAFLGRTRTETHPEFGSLIRLEYEVYEPMAIKLLEAMAADAVKRWGCEAIRIAHAQGPVLPGQASVVIQVATPHRSEAFLACRHLIDRIKHELPIWKREIWERGETFVEGCCAKSPEETAHAEHDHGAHGHAHAQPAIATKPAAGSAS